MMLVWNNDKEEETIYEKEIICNCNGNGNGSFPDGLWVILSRYY